MHFTVLQGITQTSVPFMSESMACTQLAVEFNAAIPALSSARKQSDRIAKQTLAELMRDGVDQLSTLLQLRAELNTVSGTLGQVPQADDMTALEPLKEQYRVSQEIIEKSLPGTVAIEGMFEIAEQVTSLFFAG